MRKLLLDVDRVRKTARKLRKLLKKAPKRPLPGQVHDVRTYVRRVEAAFDTLLPGPRRKERRLLRDLSKIRKRAGKVRDMDVLTGDAATVHVQQEQDCSVELLQYLGAERYKYARQLQTEMKKRGPKVGRRLKTLADRFLKRIPDAEQSAATNHSVAPPETVAAIVCLSTQLSSPRTLNRTNLHPYRLKVKELRDVLRLAHESSHQEFVDALGEVKDAIGDWHDWEELVAIADEVLRHGSGCKFLPKLKEIAHEKYGRALSLANKMRNRFLHSREHRRLGPRLVIGAKAS